MRISGHQIGVQSYCFRAFRTNEEVVHAVKACGLDALELCPVHLTLEDEGVVDRTLALYRENGICISSYGVCGFTTDEAQARRLFAFARKAGITALSADLDPDALPMLERLCDEYGVKLAVHNHGRKHRYGTFAQLDALFASTSPHIGLCLDTAWMLDAGENPVAAAEHFADRLYGVHLKDFIFARNGAPEDVIVGTGNLDLVALFDVLERNGFNGYLTLEYEGDVQNPIPSVARCVEQLRNTLQR